MDNPNEITVNSVEETKVVESTQDETQPIVENLSAEILPVDDNKEESENKELEVIEPTQEVTKPIVEDCSAEILSVDTDEEHDNEDNESIEELASHYSTMTREELLHEMKELTNSESIEKMKMRSNLVRNAFKALTNESRKELKDKFIEEGGVEEDFKWEEDPTDIEFNKYYSLYREKRQNYINEQERIKQENVVKKNAILEELRLLLNSEESLKEIYDKFNLIQDKWQAIGQVPRTEVNGLWQNYHFLIEKFYDKVKMNRELRELDLKKNLDAKIELCEKVEGLMIETSINKSFKALQEIHQQWKEIGSVPMDKNEEIWERFKTASDQINKRRQDYYESMKSELENNLLAKVALCEKAEDILKKEHKITKDWNDSTSEMNDMLKLWKSIGQVPQKENEAIWTRFKSCLDSFFSAKKEVFDKMKEEQDINYNKKVEICVKAESIVERTDWKYATQELLDLQKQWKEIGYVSKKLSDKLWERFRASCDKFFENKSAFYVANRANETENMAKKEALIKAVQEFVFGEDKEENLSAIKEFQRQWSEIGYVPSSEKERLQKEFRLAVNSHFEKLQINARDFQLNSFKERLANNGGDERNGFKEKRFLQEKIQKLKDDLNLWENNLGFLASSKQADVLKAEFEKKMQNARKDIALNEAKLKMLDNATKAEEK
jgi:hypothetical protein